MKLRKVPATLMAIALVWSATPLAAKVQPRNANERAVVGLIEMAFNEKKPAEAFAKFGGSYYRQHNPTAPDGKDAIVGMLGGWLPTVPDLHYDIKRIISRGDMVWIHSHVTMNAKDRGQAVVDIFRLENRRIVEHWDVGTAVPEKALNDNTMF